MAHLVQVLNCNLKGCGFDSPWGHLSGRTMTLRSTQSLTEWVPGMSPGTKDPWCLWLTTLPSSCAAFLEFWGSSNSWNPTGLYRPLHGFLPLARHRRKRMEGKKIVLNYINWSLHKLILVWTYEVKQDSQCTYNVTLGHFVQLLSQWKIDEYYMTCVSVFVVLVIQRAMRMRHIVIFGQPRSTVLFQITS